MTLERQPPWFVRIAERTHPLLLPVVVAALLFLPYLFLDQTGSIFLEYGMSERRRLGTILMFTILPAYALIMQYYAWRISWQTAQDYAPVTPASARIHARRAVAPPGWWKWPVVVVGTVLGLYDFSQLNWLTTLGSETAFDLWFRFLAFTTWAIVFWMLCWRLHSALQFKALGAKLELDVYELDGLSGFVRQPLFSLLMVAGAMALMPLAALV